MREDIPQETEHDRHTVLEIKHNLNALDVESLTPWSVDVIPEHKYLRIREAACLAIWKLEMAESTDDALRTMIIKDELVEAMRTVEIRDLVEAGVRLAREKRSLKWTHSA